MIILRTILTILLLCGSSWAAQLDLSKDAQGWTVFTPSSDSRILYVSATGNDGTATTYTSANHPDWSHPQSPTGTINAFATYAAAYAQTRAGYPDWVLFKRGDTFTQTVGTSLRSGRSATEPFLIGAYGSLGASPLIKTGNATGLYFLGSNAWAAVSGLDFYSNVRDPDGGEYTGASGNPGLSIYATGGTEKIQGILIEGCKFRFYGFGMNIQGDNEVVDGVTIYKNVILDSYLAAGNSSGLYTYRVHNLVLSENVFDHNGWYDPASGSIGVAMALSHNTYVNEIVGLTMEKNILARAASSSSKFRADATNTGRDQVVNNNLQVGGETGFAWNGEGTVDSRFSNLTITNNVITNLGYPQPTERTLAWGFELNSVSTANLSGNYIIDQKNTAINNCYGILTNNRLTDATIDDNVFYDFYNAHGILIEDPAPTSTISNVTFSGNKIQLASYSGYTINTDYDPSGKWTFSGNQYYSSRGTGTRYNLVSSDVTLAAWQAATGDDSTFEQVSFPDPSRNIASYMTSIGMTGTLDAFFTAIRAQDRYSWDSRFNAATINDYIKAGFGETPEPTCSDGIQNGDETGVDCGGSCTACGGTEAYTPIGAGTTAIGAGTTAITP